MLITTSGIALALLKVSLLWPVRPERAGENTKIVFTGDVHQIDTPYLDENSNGLAYLIDRLKGQELFTHVKLEKGERSELANLANDLL